MRAIHFLVFFCMGVFSAFTRNVQFNRVKWMSDFVNMAFVTVPKDLSKVKTKVALNLTKRQLVCFGAAAAIGVPTYIFTRGAIGNSAGALLMIAVMFPLFFMGIYEKDGMPAEAILRNFARTRFAWPGRRPYMTDNLYETLEKEGKDIASDNKQTAKAAVSKRPAGKGKPR